MSIAHKNAHTIIRDILSKQHIERVWFVGALLNKSNFC